MAELAMLADRQRTA